MTISRNHSTPLLLALGLLVLSFTAGCENLLSAENPGVIQEENLDNPELIDLFRNGVIGEFQPMYTSLALHSAKLSGELLDRHTYFPHRPINSPNQRTHDETNQLNNSQYTSLSRARASADSLSGRIEQLLGAEAESSLDLALTRAYAGYTYVLLGEAFCSAPIDVSEAYSSDELIEMSFERFDDAIARAEQAMAGGGSVSEAEDIINLAHVGAARGALQLGDMERAIAYAEQVPEDYERWVHHSDNSSREYNHYFDASSGENNRYIGVNVDFQNLDDPRIPHTDEEVVVLDDSELYVPFQPSSFSGWEAGEQNGFDRFTNVRLASGLEAQYIIAEAEGPTGATLDFVNERRAVGNQGTVNYSGEELMAELREQRARDFYLSGQRLGDLRRYIDLYNEDYFPSGDYPGGTTDPESARYGDMTCFVISEQERNANPNIN